MNQATLIRLPHPTCTPGVLLIDGNLALTTIELPWLNNQHNVSAIPVGTYNVQWDPFIGRYRLHDVPDRTGIRIDVANYPAQLKGCIAIGFGLMNIPEKNYQATIRSEDANLYLHKVMGNLFQLTIRNL